MTGTLSNCFAVAVWEVAAGLDKYRPNYQLCKSVYQGRTVKIPEQLASQDGGYIVLNQTYLS